MFKTLFVVLLCGFAVSATALPLASRYALVVEEGSGKVLFAKNADIAVPIASLTKLMTAMVVLDANPDMDEAITIEDPSVLTKAHSKTRLTDGGLLTRRTVLELALMSSDNHAAVSLAYAFPGGIDAFVAAVAAKVDDLGMTHTHIEEPTGLSKTGFTLPAGRCLIMRLKAGEQTIIVVLLNATNLPSRTIDALNVRRYLAGEQPLLAKVDHPRRTRHASHHAPVNARMGHRFAGFLHPHSTQVAAPTGLSSLRR